MSVYLLVGGTVTDEQAWARYREAVVPLIARFGGKHLTKGETPERLEGSDDWRVALFEFASMDALQAFWTSPEYRPVRALRDGAATLDIWAVPGA